MSDAGEQRWTANEVVGGAWIIKGEGAPQGGYLEWQAKAIIAAFDAALTKLEADTKRLDWLEKRRGVILARNNYTEFCVEMFPTMLWKPTIREAIDAALTASDPRESGG